MSDLPQEAKGTMAAVIIILRQNPKLSPKQVAAMLHVSPRRVQQAIKSFGHFIHH